MKREYIEPTRKEKSEWKKHLYNNLSIISEYHDDCIPKKKDSFETLVEKYLYWADEYNDSYFTEKDEVGKDRFSSYLVQTQIENNDYDLFKELYNHPFE